MGGRQSIVVALELDVELGELKGGVVHVRRSGQLAEDPLEALRRPEELAVLLEAEGGVVERRRDVATAREALDHAIVERHRLQAVSLSTATYRFVEERLGVVGVELVAVLGSPRFDAELLELDGRRRRRLARGASHQDEEHGGDRDARHGETTTGRGVEFQKRVCGARSSVTGAVTRDA